MCHSAHSLIYSLHIFTGVWLKQKKRREIWFFSGLTGRFLPVVTRYTNPVSLPSLLSYAAQLQVYLGHNRSNNNCSWGGNAAGFWCGTAATAVHSSRWLKLGIEKGKGRKERSRYWVLGTGYRVLAMLCGVWLVETNARRVYNFYHFHILRNFSVVAYLKLFPLCVCVCVFFFPHSPTSSLPFSLFLRFALRCFSVCVQIKCKCAPKASNDRKLSVNKVMLITYKTEANKGEAGEIARASGRETRREWEREREWVQN